MALDGNARFDRERATCIDGDFTADQIGLAGRQDQIAGDAVRQQAIVALRGGARRAGGKRGCCGGGGGDVTGEQAVCGSHVQHHIRQACHGERKRDRIRAIQGNRSGANHLFRGGQGRIAEGATVVPVHLDAILGTFTRQEIGGEVEPQRRTIGIVGVKGAEYVGRTIFARQHIEHRATVRGTGIAGHAPRAIEAIVEQGAGKRAGGSHGQRRGEQGFAEWKGHGASTIVAKGTSCWIADATAWFPLRDGCVTPRSPRQGATPFRPVPCARSQGRRG